MRNTATTARAIEARLSALRCNDTALLDALRAVDDKTDEGEAAGVFEWAGEASTNHTEDGCWDEAIDEAFGEWSDAE